MSELESLALPATAIVTVVGLLVVVLASRKRPGNGNGRPEHARPAPGPRSQRAAMTMPCNRCGTVLEIPRNALLRLTGVEKALTIRSNPALAHRELAEFACPHCAATHCFVQDGGEWAWAGSNLYIPQQSLHRCAECETTISHVEPQPSQGAAFADARALRGETGVRCNRCAALVCIDCLLRRTRGYQPGASLICPRCGRAAVGPPLEIR